MEEETEVFIGSGNVFADLDLPNPDELQLKSDLALQLRRGISDKRLTETQATERMGLDAAEFSRLREGPSADFTLERLFYCLNRLGLNVEVRVSEKRLLADNAPLTVAA